MKTIVLFCLAALAAAGARGAELTVHAAASLTDALKELAPAYEQQSGDKLRFNFGASSQLARQIKEGAPGAVFFTLGNALVIVVPADSKLAIASAADLAKPEVKKVAVAEPSSVPVGVYTKEYLSRLGLWDKVSPKVVPTENVRASLAAVESGNAEAGTVYKTDALIYKKVRIAYEVPTAEGPRILYPLAALKDSKDPAAARRLLAFLGGSEARIVFARYGFAVLK